MLFRISLQFLAFFYNYVMYISLWCSFLRFGMHLSHSIASASSLCLSHSRRLWSKWIPTYEKFGAQEFHNLIVVTAAPAAVAESTAVSLYAYIHTYKHSSTLLTAFAICLPSFTFFICSLQLLLNSRFCGIFLWNLYAYVRKISKAASRRRWRRVRASAMNADLLAGSSCVANVTLKLGIKWQNELHQLQKRQQQQKHYKV